MVESKVPEMPLAVAVDVLKARTSSEVWKPEEMVTVADSMLVSSTSVKERVESMTEAPSFSVKARVAPAPPN